jgi:hypothetical protein
LEFPAELIGTTAQCPRCRKQTELMLPAPPIEPLVPRKVIIWTLATSMLLVLGAIAFVIGVKHFADLAAQQKGRDAASKPGAAGGFEISVISVEKEPGASESYAVGTVVNTSSRPRSGVAVQLDILDAAGGKVGVVRAFRPTLAAGAKWSFKVPTGADKAASAKVTSIKEGQ